MSIRTSTVRAARHRAAPLPLAALPLALALLTALAVLAAGAAPVLADDARAREIMQKVNNRDDGDNRTSQLDMVLTDKNGALRERRLRDFTKDRGDDTLSLIFFLDPADVKDTGFLSYDYDAPGKDDDQWLYLPALRKTKRIASDDKSGSFMGTDFNFSDMTEPDLEDYDFTLMKEVEVEGHMTWQIESVPRSDEVADETGYERSVSWVRQDNYVTIRAIRWVYKSNEHKLLEIKRLEQIDGIWTVLEMEMRTREGRNTVHSTSLKFTDVKYNQDLSEDDFTVRRLERGT